MRDRRYSDHGGRRRDVERLGPSGRSGIRAQARRSVERHRPAGPRARRRGRSTTGGSARPRQRRRRRARPAPAWCRRGRPSPAARRRAGEDRAHARAHRLRRVGVGAARPEHDRAVGERVRGADDRADVAGVARRRAGRRRRPPPASLHALPVDADHPGARARASLTASSSSGSTSSPATQDELRLGPGRPRPPRPGPRPRPRTGPRARVLALARACGSASASRCVAGDHRLRVLVRKQKGRPAPVSRPGSRDAAVASRPPWPPGLARQIGETPPGRGRRCRRASCG